MHEAGGWVSRPPPLSRARALIARTCANIARLRARVNAREATMCR